ncbi:MAG: DUF1552 domain-containing protein [Gemmataceae bacterium]
MAINRRDALKGVSLGAGTMVLAPLVQKLEAHAAGRAQSPKRFLFVVEGNGLPWQQIQPVGINRSRRTSDRNQLVNMPLGEHALPQALEPINAWKDKVTIVQGLSGRICGGGHSNNFGALGVYDSQGGVGHCGTPVGETIDVALGKKLGGIFKQVGLGMVDRRDATVVYNCSAWDRGKPMPTQTRPNLAYGSLFGSVAGGAAQQEFTAQSNMLDYLRDDIQRLERTATASEREILQSHVHALEAMGDRQSRLNEIQNTLRRHAPVVNNKYTSNVETDRLDAQFDIAAATLISGLTNVVTIASGAGDPYFSVRFTGLGINLGKHGIGHGNGYNGKSAAELGTTIRRFHFELIARLMQKLQAVPEGNGTMLDNTLIVYLSDAAEGHHSRCWEWPFVLVGNLGGALNAGRYIEYPYWGLQGHREIGNLYTTFLHAVGDRRNYFGVKEPNLRHLDQDGPLSELLRS